MECADGSLYTGITNDLKARISAHESGTGAKYTKGRGPFKLMYQASHGTRSAASKQEIMVKRLSRLEKLKICNQSL